MSTGLAAAAARHRPGSASPARRTRSGGEGGRRGCDGGQRRALAPSSVSWALFMVHRSTSLPRLHACDCRVTTRTVDAWWTHHLPQAAAREEVRRGYRLPIRLHLEAHARFRWLRCPRARALYIDRGRENGQESEEAPAARAPVDS